jgi:hypothetical protein
MEAEFEFCGQNRHGGKQIDESCIRLVRCSLARQWFNPIKAIFRVKCTLFVVIR